MDLKSFIRDIPDFPKPGILFYDITPLLNSPEAFRETVECFAKEAQDLHPTKVVGIEARGFLFSAAVAYRLGIGFTPVRKPGKLPYETIRENYLLEYGSDSLEMHKDALCAGDRVILVDDLLATGGTMEAAIRLVEKTGAKVVGVFFVVELGFLNGREKLRDRNVLSLITY
ncbi:MAG: adenine phosphoribosyltransferase [Candidatus Latescibacterota bacterium]